MLPPSRATSRVAVGSANSAAAPPGGAYHKRVAGWNRGGQASPPGGTEAASLAAGPKGPKTLAQAGSDQRPGEPGWDWQSGPSRVHAGNKPGGAVTLTSPRHGFSTKLAFKSVGMVGLP